MLEAFRGLTLRGRAFLAAGLTAIVCAAVLGQGPLVRVGVMVAALPLIAAVVLSRGRYRLTLERHLDPAHTAVGNSVRIDLRLNNDGHLPTGTLQLEERLPYSLGQSPRFVVHRIGQGWHREIAYRVRSDLRGRFRIGPMTVGVSDPFGLVRLSRSFASVADLTVTPRVVPLAPVPLRGAETTSGDSRPREFHGGSPEDVTVREYRHGDDLRRVHWRSSARAGELMVRREEQPFQARATIYLDNRRRAHRGQGAHSSFETAVVAAASVATHLAHRGFAVRLVTADTTGPTPWHSRETDTELSALLTELATVQLSGVALVEPGWTGEAGSGGITIAILGRVDDADGTALRRIRHQAGTALAIDLDVEAWDLSAERSEESPGASAHSCLSLLTHHGWQAAPLSASDPLPEVWQRLTVSGRRTSTEGAGR